ncbi:hypothetical protein Taro_045580 [Colocasia esculenta]|uniref:Uncharacterized protein n=1 Tax=Colocasia esculenta TaxID=4460 RepID=A0A843X2Z9_COLES|nr:hypothetical protein [Colocasia esculenta]
MCTCTPIVEPLGRTWIFVRLAIGTAREAPIQNQHFDPAGTRSYLEISGLKNFVLHSKSAIPADALPVSMVFSQ